MRRRTFLISFFIIWHQNFHHSKANYLCHYWHLQCLWDRIHMQIIRNKIIIPLRFWQNYKLFLRYDVIVLLLQTLNQFSKGEDIWWKILGTQLLYYLSKVNFWWEKLKIQLGHKGNNFEDSIILLAHYPSQDCHAYKMQYKIQLKYPKTKWYRQRWRLARIVIMVETT